MYFAPPNFKTWLRAWEACRCLDTWLMPAM